jgi:hypothetical protein
MYAAAEDVSKQSRMAATLARPPTWINAARMAIGCAVDRASRPVEGSPFSDYVY